MNTTKAGGSTGGGEMPALRASELVVFLAVAVAFLGLQMCITSAASLPDRLPWLDEMHSIQLVSDVSAVHAIMALKGGADTNPPVYYLVCRGLSRILRMPVLSVLRWASMGSTLLALVGVYACLRLAFGRLPSIAGSLSIWAHPIVQQYSWEARSYTMWLAAQAWFIYCVMLSSRREKAGFPEVAAALLAYIACTLHYFGVISILLVLAVQFAVLWSTRRPVMRDLVPLLGVGAAMLTLLPFYFSQRGTISVTTWVDPPSIMTSLAFLANLMNPPVLAGCAVLAWVTVAFRDSRCASEPADGLILRRLAGMTSLLLMPPAVILFSYVIQPALIERYALVAVIGLGPVAAFLVDRRRAAAVIVAVVGLMAYSTVTLESVARTLSGEDGQRRMLAESIRKAAGTCSGEVVFERRHDYWPVCYALPGLAGRMRLLDLEREEMIAPNDMDVHDRDMMRNLSKFYPDLRVIRLDDLRRKESFVFVSRNLDTARLRGILAGHVLAGQDGRALCCVRSTGE